MNHANRRKNSLRFKKIGIKIEIQIIKSKKVAGRRLTKTFLK